LQQASRASPKPCRRSHTQMAAGLVSPDRAAARLACS
jgi:hypothetical protein